MKAVEEETIDFLKDPSRSVDEDGWICFDVNHSTSGVHALQMVYATLFSCPCRIRVGNRELNFGVACGSTGNDDRPKSFTEGFVDLYEGPVTRVAFLAQRANEWPQIKSFRFIPESEFVINETPTSSKKAIHKSLWHNTTEIFRDNDGSEDDDDDDNSVDHRRSVVRLNSKDFKKWNTTPTAITFSFEIGIPCEEGWGEEDVEVITPYLRGKAIKFTYGAAHDSITIDGNPIGNKEGGDNWPIVYFYAKHDIIDAVTLGLSSYQGEGAFNSLVLKREHSKHAEHVKRILVGSEFNGPTYTFDRQRLGLNLWLTSIYAPKNQPVSRYGFTLSSDPTVEFNQKEFEIFWDWLIQVKHQMVLTSDNKRHYKEEQPLITHEEVRNEMSELHDFLLSSFSCCPANPYSKEGYLYGTTHHINIVFDVFSVCIYRLPDGVSFQSILFVDGVQYNRENSSLEELNMRRNDILGFAISLALQDDELLRQMGLAIPDKTEDQLLGERELLPLRKDDLFNGNYQNTPMARRIICVLAMTGLRQVTHETITSNESDEWDIYCLASAHRATFGRRGGWIFYQLTCAAFFCFLIQLFTPILVIYRSIADEREDLTWDTYIVRFLFCVYAIFYEAKSWEVDNGDRIVAWLSFLPEFNSPRLILGMAINKLSKVVVSVSIVIIILHSYTVLDVTLNALAMYFVLDVDNLLVNPTALEKIKKYHRREYFAIKSKTAIAYSSPKFDEAELPLIKDLPARFFRMASNNISTFCIVLLGVGAIYMIVEPFILGWEA